MGFPTINSIANAVKTSLNSSFSHISSKLDSLSTKIQNLPTQIVNTMTLKAGTEIAFIVKKVKGITADLKDAVEFTSHLVILLQNRRKNFNPATFRKKLIQFFGDIILLAKQLPRILMKFNTPAVLQKNFSGEIFSKMPIIALLPLSLVLEAAPGWEEKPRKILDVVKKLPSLADRDNKGVYTEELYILVYEASILVKVLITLNKALGETTPKDLSVTLNIVGEGGGTQISGHPAKLPFVTLGLVLELIDIAFTNFITLYDRYSK